MKGVKIAAAIAIVAITAFAFERVTVAPYRCNLIMTRVMRRTEAMAAAGDITARIAARVNLDLLRDCTEWCRNEVNCLAVTAANETALGDARAAAASYEQALTIERRPELYLYLGLAQWNMLQTEKATETFMTGARFNYSINESVPEPVQSIVRARISRERAMTKGTP